MIEKRLTSGVRPFAAGVLVALTLGVASASRAGGATQQDPGVLFRG